METQAQQQRLLGDTKFLEQHFASQALTDQKLCLYVCYLPVQ